MIGGWQEMDRSRKRGTRNLSIRDLLDLAVADVAGAEERIEKIFEWHFDRAKTISQWILGAAASLSISVLISISKQEWKLSAPFTTIILMCAVATGAYGAYNLWQLRSLSRQFVAALKLYSELTGIRAFVGRYRERVATAGDQRWASTQR
jgi:hypothetical protein